MEWNARRFCREYVLKNSQYLQGSVGCAGRRVSMSVIIKEAVTPESASVVYTEGGARQRSGGKARMTTDDDDMTQQSPRKRHRIESVQINNQTELIQLNIQDCCINRSLQFRAFLKQSYTQGDSLVLLVQ
jgi:hypothetical protein